LRSPAVWLFTALYLACAAFVIAIGQVQALLIGVGSLVGTILLVLITIPLTAHAPAPAWMEMNPPRSKARLWIQAGVVLLVILLIYQSLFAGNRLLPRSLAYVPVWTPLLNGLFRVQQSLSIPPNYLLTPVTYLVIPLAALLLLGAHPRELGFGRGYRAWRVAAIWCSLPLAILVSSLALGQVSLGFLPGRTLQTTLNSGPFEEFLFRGALMTRLSRPLGVSWGIVLSSIVFGMGHVVTDTQGQTHNQLLVGMVIGILQQGAGSLGLAIVFHRTRNLLATSVIHVVTNVSFG
jgi:membrane protease YdiL (CAAX protease family)